MNRLLDAAARLHCALRGHVPPPQWARKPHHAWERPRCWRCNRRLTR